MTIFDENDRHMITIKRLRGQGLRKLVCCMGDGASA